MARMSRERLERQVWAKSYSMQMSCLLTWTAKFVALVNLRTVVLGRGCTSSPGLSKGAWDLHLARRGISECVCRFASEKSSTSLSTERTATQLLRGRSNVNVALGLDLC